MTRMLWLHALCWLALAMHPPVAVASEETEKQHQRASRDFFSTGAVLQLHIQLPPAAIESLKKDSREFVKATVKEGACTFVEVGIHLKGKGSFRPIDEKPSFTLKFNQFTPGQRFHGLTKIMLNNSVQDPTYVQEALCTALFREAGVPAARVIHARVWLNERALGLYALVEGLNKDFLKENFQNCDGALYEPYLQDIDEELKQDNGGATARGGMEALLKATREADAHSRWQRLEKTLDTERFISMLAGEILMAHWDGYWMNHNNYRIYHDTTHDRMVLIPYGLDSMFQQPTMPWQPPRDTLLVQAVLHTTEGQRQYRERIRNLHQELFRPELLMKRVNEIAARIRPILARESPNTLTAWEKAIAELGEHIVQRAKFLSEQLPPQ